MAENFTSIPTIDFAQASHAATKPAFLSELRDALVKVGFFYLKNHSVSRQAQQGLIQTSKVFFDLTAAEKHKANMVNSKHFRGYSGVAVEKTATLADQREAFICADETPAPGPEEPEYRNLRGPNLWPDEITAPGFRAAVEAYLTELRQLSDQFKFLVAEALDIKTEAMGALFEKNPPNLLKLLQSTLSLLSFYTPTTS